MPKQFWGLKLVLFEGTWRGIEALDEVDFVYDDDDMDVLGKKLKIS